MLESENSIQTADFDLLNKISGLDNDIVDSEHPAVAQVLSGQNTEDSFEDLNICFNRADQLAGTVGIELTPNPHTDLEEIVSAIAVSNTDVSLESVGSVSELASKFWAAAFQKLNASWDNIFEYMLKTESKVIYLLSRVQQAESELDRRAEGTSKVTAIDLTKSAEYLAIRHQMPHARELKVQLDRLSRDASILLTERTALTIEYLHRVLGSLESILESRDIEHVRNDLRNVARFGFEIQKQTNLLRSKMNGRTGSQDTETGKTITILGEYLGSRAVVMYTKRANEADMHGDGKALMKMIDDIFSTDIIVSHEESKLHSTAFTTLSLSEASALLKSAHDLLKEVERFNLRFQDEVSTLRTDFKRLRHDLSKAGASADLQEFNLYVRKAAYAAQRSTQWMFNPYVPFTTFILHVAHATIILAETSIATHKLK